MRGKWVKGSTMVYDEWKISCRASPTHLKCCCWPSPCGLCVTVPGTTPAPSTIPAPNTTPPPGTTPCPGTLPTPGTTPPPGTAPTSGRTWSPGMTPAGTTPASGITPTASTTPAPGTTAAIGRVRPSAGPQLWQTLDIRTNSKLRKWEALELSTERRGQI